MGEYQFISLLIKLSKEKTNEEFLNLADDQLLITPHNAYNSKDAVYEMERMLIESLEDVLNNRNIKNLV